MTIDLLNNTSLTSFGSSDPTRPDYVCPAYREMAGRWSLVDDIRAGTSMLRQKREFYLPKFEAETLKDWDARVNMTFVADHYATTLAEHVGLVMAVPPKIGDDVPQAIKDLLEDIDGEGNHFDVFAQTALDAQLHLGHCVLLTDYPPTATVKNRSEERAMQARPYVTLYRACDVLSWRWAVVGGVRVLSQIMFRETSSEPAGEYGVAECVRLREFRQEVYYDQITGRARALGPITWQTWKQDQVEAGTTGATTGALTFTPTGTGVIVGPERIPARVAYGGERIGLLHSKPHLIGLAFSNVEETQVSSDYASIMHKANVPTPIFIGRNTGDATKTVQMGQGIDIPTGGDAKFLEPSGAALGATRTRIEDLRAQMRRQGATTDDATGKVMTAAEAGLYAKQRNAKLARAARSLQDALEGVLDDMAAFMQLPEGGSVAINQDFAGEGIDPAYLTVLVSAYNSGALPIEALMYALEKGRLPEDFQSEDAALKLVADQLAKEDEINARAKQLAADNAANSQVDILNADGSTKATMRRRQIPPQTS